MSGDRLRVLLVSPLPPPVGGIATWTRILLREMAAHPDIEIAHLDTAVRWRAVTQVSTPARLLGGTAQALRDYLRFRRMLRASRPGLMHLCTSAGFSLRKDLLMLRASAARDVPSIVHFRMGRIPALAQGSSAEWSLLRRCAETAAMAIVLDRRSRACLSEACPSAEVRALPNMVDIAAVDAVIRGTHGMDRAAAAASPSFAYVGHVLPSKGVTDLVEALCASGQELRLDVVGPAEESYRRVLAERAGSRIGLRFHGTLSHEDALKAIRQADVFALPSHSEGFPNVVAEAMACARPVLATDVGAMAEMLDADGREPCGICVSARDVEGLSRAVRRLSGDAELRAVMGARGRHRAETEYAAPVVTEKLTSLWREVGYESRHV